MRNLLLLWYFLSSVLLSINLVPASGQCLENQRSLLLEMNNTLIFRTSLSTKLVTWDQSVDCCSWEGVTCNEEGHVTGLDLSNEYISGGINNSSSLFELQYLQSLDLSGSAFGYGEIPHGFDKLTSLTYLNLSNSGFGGQIPTEISRMTSLLTLDLTYNYLQLNLAVLVQNLTELRQLYLDYIGISAERNNDWCQALSSSLPNLQVLSLQGCQLSGPIDSSLEKLQSLSVIRLDFNDLSAPFPDFFANFPSLTHLGLSGCGLYGTFPEKMFQLSTLQFLDISQNERLLVFLPDSPLNGAFQTLALSFTNIFEKVAHSNSTGNFTRLIPNSLGNFKMLSRLELSGCDLNGPIQISLANLTRLVHLDLSKNSLNGNIPSLLLANPSSSVLEVLDLSSNNLEGPVPLPLFKIRNLRELDLSSNKFNGTIDISTIRNLCNLTKLSLSHNNLSVITSDDDLSLPDTIVSLELASCNLRVFPNLRNQLIMNKLDLSDNAIEGKIPNWIWNIFFFHLNLSCNFLVDVGPLPNLSSFIVLDLHSNMLQGQIQNLFPADTNYGYVSLANNKFTGYIPESICNCHGLQVLDLSNNTLNGPIPPCLFYNTTSTLRVLNLRNNHLHGSIPATFSSQCNLRTIDLSGNKIEGRVPKVIGNCKNLQVLNLGNNQINDKFPCWIRNLPSLRVLILRSNRFQGQLKCTDTHVTWPELQILDLASNNFSGNLPAEYFSSLKAMLINKDGSQPKLSYLHYEFPERVYYKDTVMITSKGRQLELVKILTIFTSIDFSNNMFQGQIPEEVGHLVQLYLLNISHNAFTGQIPSSFGNLKQIESLDLSNNNLSGAIPMQFSNLNFLAFLNLSYNNLVGSIPSSTQLQSFTQASFKGNKRLCGAPLDVKCKDDRAEGSLPPTLEDNHLDVEADEIKWEIIAAEIGYVFGLGVSIGPLIFCKRTWYYKRVDQIVRMILCSKKQRGNRGRRSH